MVREESRNSRAKTRFSQKRKNVNSRELVNPSDLGLIEAVWIHHKELEKPPKSRAPKLVKSKRKSSHERITTHEFDARSKTPEGTRRIGPPFPIKSNTRSQKSILQILPLRREREEERKGERAHGRGERRACCPGKREREKEREWVRRYLCPLTLELKD